MAKVIGQSIPPSLLALYQRHLDNRSPWNVTETLVSASNNLFAQAPPNAHPTLIERAQITAEWLADHHNGGISKGARTQFIADRRAEIIAGNFPVEYWMEIVDPAPQALLYEPVSVVDHSVVDPAYLDLNRQPTLPNYQIVPTKYALPAPYSGLPQPSPGFFGDVQATEYRDRWHVAIMAQHYLGQWLAERKTAMIWIKVDWQIEASASHRANAYWLRPNVHWVKGTNPFQANDARWSFFGRVAPRYRWRYGINPPATPWAQTTSGTELIDFTQWYYDSWASRTDQLSVQVAAPPAFGRYFSLNDWCRSWLSATIKVYRSQSLDE